jgi:sulfide:quinone oxidoreductase
LSSDRHVIVVGAGPGGLAAAARLRERGDGRVAVTLISPGLRATFLGGTLDVALGEQEPAAFTAAVDMAGVRCLDAAVSAVAPDGVALDDQRLAADAVIAAPGLAVDAGSVPSWSRAVAAWDPYGARRLRERVLDPPAGRVLVAVTAVPYRCPPAPLALAVGLAGRHLEARHAVRVTVSTPEPVPLAGVGGDAPAFVSDACAAAGVTLERAFMPDLQASADGVLRATDGREIPYDGAFLVPAHRRAACLEGLPTSGPLVAVGDRGSVDGSLLYVVGDAAATGLPRAAGFAAGAAVAAADGALEALGIAPAPAPPVLEASCFMFHHGGAISRISVRYAGGGATVRIDGPSRDLRPARAGELRRFREAASA